MQDPHRQHLWCDAQFDADIVTCRSGDARLLSRLGVFKSALAPAGLRTVYFLVEFGMSSTVFIVALVRCRIRQWATVPIEDWIPDHGHVTVSRDLNLRIAERGQLFGIWIWVYRNRFGTSNCKSSTPLHGFCGFIFVLSARWRVSAAFLLELSSVGEFLDFVSNAQRAPREDFQRDHAVAMPLREGIRNHAVGHQRHLARKARMLLRKTQSSSAVRRR